MAPPETRASGSTADARSLEDEVVAVLWAPANENPKDHPMAAKVLREISNLAKKSPLQIPDLCERLKAAMEADTVEESKDIISGAFNEDRLTLTDVLNCSRLFFELANVMRILRYPVAVRKTIISHLMHILFDDPQDKSTLEGALTFYRSFREQVTPP